jgi:hypothetical protein
MRLQGSIRPVEQVCRDDRDTMFALMAGCYANIRRSAFEADLDAKHWVLQLRSRATGELVGFSTQVLLHVEVLNTTVDALYSGDTVVDRCHWGDPALAHIWGNFALSLMKQSASRSLYWFLTSKGFRTYRFLPLFFRDFYPRTDVRTPPWESAVLDALGRQVAPTRFDDVRQIIRADSAKDYLRSEIGSPQLRIKKDHHVRFFVESNPGHAHGDELCCLAPLNAENFTRAAYRMIDQSLSDLQPT